MSLHLTSTSFTTLGWSSFLRMAISWYTCSMGPLGWMQPPETGRVPRGGGRPKGDMNHTRVRAKRLPPEDGSCRWDNWNGGSQWGWNGWCHQEVYIAFSSYASSAAENQWYQRSSPFLSLLLSPFFPSHVSSQSKLGLYQGMEKRGVGSDVAISVSQGKSITSPLWR